MSDVRAGRAGGREGRRSFPAGPRPPVSRCLSPHTCASRLCVPRLRTPPLAPLPGRLAGLVGGSITCTYHVHATLSTLSFRAHEVMAGGRNPFRNLRENDGRARPRRRISAEARRGVFRRGRGVIVTFRMFR